MIRLGDIGKKWKAIGSVGATVIATTTSFFRPPPVGESSQMIAIGGFLATVCSGLIYVAMVRWSAPKHALRWVATAAAGALLAVTSFYLYASYWDSHVAVYQGRPVVVGHALTAEGAEWVRRSGRTDPSLLLFDATGQPDQIWTADSIRQARSRLRLLYLSGFPLVAVAILGTLQAVHCVMQKAKPRKKAVGSRPPRHEVKEGV
jgi:hypothetical protein